MPICNGSRMSIEFPAACRIPVIRFSRILAYLSIVMVLPPCNGWFDIPFKANRGDLGSLLYQSQMIYLLYAIAYFLVWVLLLAMIGKSKLLYLYPLFIIHNFSYLIYWTYCSQLISGFKISAPHFDMLPQLAGNTVVIWSILFLFVSSKYLRADKKEISAPVAPGVDQP